MMMKGLKVVPVDLLERVETYLTAAIDVGMSSKFQDGSETPNCRSYREMAAQIRDLLAAPAAPPDEEVMAWLDSEIARIDSLHGMALFDVSVIYRHNTLCEVRARLTASVGGGKV